MSKLIKYHGATYVKVARPFVAPTSTAVLPKPGEKLPPDQQLALLRYSVAEWNRWYRTVEDFADLRGAYLNGANLKDTDLLGARLEGANLQGADLQDATYNKATQFPKGFDPKASGMVLK